MIYVENRRRKLEKIQADYPDAIILDITSNSSARYSQLLSPFYPHYNIPVPFTDGMTAACVEGIWQGLKVFATADVDRDTLNNDTMKGLKRTVRRYGTPLGHRKGFYGKELLNYFDARMQIYLPTYKWVMDNIPEVHNVLMKIKNKSKESDIVLLDYNTNTDFRDITKPISHAGLVKAYIEDAFPDLSQEYTPMNKEELEGKKAALKVQKDKVKKQAKFARVFEEKGLFDK